MWEGLPSRGVFVHFNPGSGLKFTLSKVPRGGGGVGGRGEGVVVVVVSQMSLCPVTWAAGRGGGRERSGSCVPHRSPLCADTPPPDSLTLLLGQVLLVPAPGEMSPLTMRMFVLLLLPLSQAAPKDGTTR